MQPTNPTPRPPGKADVSGLNSSASKGAAKHFKKMKTQNQQVASGEGAFTAGLATSPGAPKVSNSAGKFLAKGKN